MHRREVHRCKSVCEPLQIYNTHGHIPFMMVCQGCKAQHSPHAQFLIMQACGRDLPEVTQLGLHSVLRLCMMQHGALEVAAQLARPPGKDTFISLWYTFGYQVWMDGWGP